METPYLDGLGGFVLRVMESVVKFVARHPEASVGIAFSLLLCALLVKCLLFVSKSKRY